MSCHAIEYKKISEGFSGSKVFRVIPHKIRGGTPVKYVIKVSSSDSQKLAVEENNFKNNVEGYDNRYSIHSERTEKLCAIKYNFASDDGISDSQSFNEILKSSKDFNKLSKIVNDLYAIKLFEDWHESKIEKKKIFEFYKDYIKTEKILASIQKILDLTKPELKQQKLLINLEKILDKEIELKVKICHGDLHSGNFFIDSNSKIFLIDFGDTTEKHALIDYTALECSIKFRHIPFFINIDDLILIEKIFNTRKFFSK